MHGIPVEIRFEDDRQVSDGDLYLDFPQEPLQFPCYALFLDPANAIVLRTRPGRPSPEEGEVPEITDQLIESQISQRLLTSKDALKEQTDHPGRKGRVCQALVNTERIGHALFSRGYKDFPRENDLDEKRQFVASLEELRSKYGEPEIVRYNDSWGPISKDDLRVRVTIL
jgi:hypothetical protein